MLARVAILVRIALANLFASFLNVFVGIVLTFGAALLVVGGSLFSTLDQSLSRSIVGSITGHLQVYAARSKDKLEVYGKVDGSDSTLAPLDDFADLKARLLQVPNVAKVVPMGSCTAIVRAANTVDLALEKLRGLYRQRAEGGAAAEADEALRARIETARAHVRNMVKVLATDLERASQLTSQEDEAASRAVMARAASDEFWADFDQSPLDHLEYLENKVAPEVGDGDMLFMRVLGTDLAAYQATFDRLEIVEGSPVPPGKRGVLLPRFFREELLKLKNARRLDKIREGRAVGRTIATDKELQRLVRENQGQTREIVLQLDAVAAAEATRRLQAFLRTEETDLPKLLSRLFAVDDASFDAHDAFFYKELAPLLALYRAKVGDTLTLQSIGRSGSVETATLKVYGIFELRGLEKSPLAGLNVLVDMVTFRELYGYLSAERKAELDAMRAETGAKQVTRESAEDELFGSGSTLVAEAREATFEAPALRKVERRSEDFDPAEVDRGVVLHAAIMLKDGDPLAQQRAQAAVEELLGRERGPPDAAALSAAQALVAAGTLPAALSGPLATVVALEQQRAAGGGTAATAPLRALQDGIRSARRLVKPEELAVAEAVLVHARPRTWVVDWGTAAGFLGQFILFFRLALGGMVVAFAFIALIVVTIGVTIATLQRTQTIGTLRAIGAQREFVVSMVLVETLVLAVVFGLLGVGLGTGVVLWLHASGIPAFRDELYFFFSGPVLRPEVTGLSVLVALGSTLVVSLLAVLFPLFLATRVSPLTAMQSAE